MLKWFAIVGAGAALGFAGVYFALTARPAAQPAPEQPAAAAAQSAEPVVLSEVVEVTDTDRLLDPAPRPASASGVPFDPQDEDAKVTSRRPAPAPIPLASD
jgi:hypothetical protein